MSWVCAQDNTMLSPPRAGYECIKPVKHDGPHRDQHGNTWGRGS